MSTGAEFAGHRPHGEDARPDERFVRILLVEEKPELAEEIRQNLGRAARASFEVVWQSNLVEAAARIEGDDFDLLLVDPQLPNVDWESAIELANDLAHRLPVVVLTGTKAIKGSVELSSESARRAISTCVEHADVASKLLSAIRRSRRFGTGVMTPLFCRLDEAVERMGIVG